MTLLLIVLLVLLLAGGGYGWHGGYVTAGNPLGIVLIVLVILLLVGAFGATLAGARTVVGDLEADDGLKAGARFNSTSASLKS